MNRSGRSAWYRLMIVGLACGPGVLLACSGKTSPGGGGGGGNSDTQACDDYFQAVFQTSCDGSPLLPSSETTRLQGRFQTLCTAALALPGISLDPSALEACVTAVKSSGCSVLEANTGPCALNTAGSLAAGTSCVTGAQCSGGTCTADEASPDGGELLCGTCVTPPAIGQSCANGQTCGPNAACLDGASGGETCVAVTYAAAGASCSGVTQCNAGLYCDTTLTCATPGGAGAPCSEDEACALPLVCPATTGSSTCQMPGASGAPCEDDLDCGSGLGCDYNLHTCGTVTWVSAGQTCSASARCLVGNCPFTNGVTGGTCPAVIADGQPCVATSTDTTCDTYASCENDTCVFGYPSCP